MLRCAEEHKTKQEVFNMSYDLPQLFIHSRDFPEHHLYKAVCVECLPDCGQHCTGVKCIHDTDFQF
jgi:hypothetical protein